MTINETVLIDHARPNRRPNRRPHRRSAQSMSAAPRPRMPGAAALAALAIFACSSLSAEPLPEARDLLERHIEAIGGREAILAQAESTMTGTFGMPAVGMEGEMIVASRKSGARATRISLPGIGEMVSGYAPDLAWSMDPFNGPRLIEGEELQAQIEQSEAGAILRDPEFVAAMETVGREEMGEQACYRVRVSWKSGRESFDCYAIDSGLLIGMESMQPSPMGDILAVTVISDYRDFGNIKAPTSSQVEVMGQTQVLVIESIEFGPPADDLFALPPAIQGLIDQRSAQ